MNLKQKTRMKKINNICCIGAGYVGVPTMAVIAEQCPKITVNVVDLNEEKINAWNDENLEAIPIYEPGLPEIVSKTRNQNLFFSSDINSAIQDADMIFISVNTPTKTYGRGKNMVADIKNVEAVAKNIALLAEDDKIIIEKSTVPVRTADTIRTIIENNKKEGVDFQILSNPEFLAEGTAIDDLYYGDRVLIGGNNKSRKEKAAIDALANIYAHWMKDEKIITTNLWSSELSKLAANAFLSQRVSSINALSALCDETGADIEEISKAVGSDCRVGPKFLNSSIGFGGSCFNKDLLNLVYLYRSFGLEEGAQYWEHVIKMNDYQRKRFAHKIIQKLNNSVNNKTITMFGWAFKKDTNDSRETPAMYVADELIEDRANIHVYDPKVESTQMIRDIDTLNSRLWEKNHKRLFSYKDPYEAAKESDAIAILTEWDEFKNFNWKKLYNNMNKPALIFDGRNILNAKKLRKIGFEVYQIGKNNV